MSIASIFVSLDRGPDSAARVRLATRLAERFEAMLTGVAARRMPSLGPAHDIQEAQSAYDELQARLTEELAQAKAMFEREAGDGIRTGWRQAEAGPVGFLVQQARMADLVVVGRKGPRDADAGEMGIAPGPVLMEVGRPVLMTPPGVEQLRAERIVVAWKDAPEARRAVSAALPFIKRADQVFVTSAGSDARFEGAEDVSHLLARHGAHVTTHLLDAPGPETTDELVRFAQRYDADLIVMGAYGRSRLSEWLFGGVTHTMLQTSPFCCLMSH